MALEEGARAGGHGLLAAGEDHVHVEVVELSAAEALGQAEREGRARGVVVLAAGGGGEGDVDQQGDGHDQQHRRDELDDGEEEAAQARQAEDAADEHGELGPEERLERADGAADELPEGCPPGLGLLAEGDAAVPGVVMGDEHEPPGLLEVAPGDDVLGRAPAEQAADGGEEEAGLEEGEEDGRQCQGGAERRQRDRDDAAEDRKSGEDRVAERPGRATPRSTRARHRARCPRAAASDERRRAARHHCQATRRPTSTRASISARRSIEAPLTASGQRTRPDAPRNRAWPRGCCAEAGSRPRPPRTCEAAAGTAVKSSRTHCRDANSGGCRRWRAQGPDRCGGQRVWELVLGCGARFGDRGRAACGASRPRLPRTRVSSAPIHPDRVGTHVRSLAPSPDEIPGVGLEPTCPRRDNGF